MKNFLIGFVSAFLLLALAGALVIYTGRAPISAADADTPLLDWLLHTGYEQALQRHAAEISVPQALQSDPLMFNGAQQFAQMCAGCHRPPEAQPTPYSAGLRPAPPDLVELMRERTPEEAFWVLDNGVHFTGMPAIGLTHSDEDLWALVEFLRRAKNMTAEDYQRVLDLAAGNGGEVDHSDHDHEH